MLQRIGRIFLIIAIIVLGFIGIAPPPYNGGWEMGAIAMLVKIVAIYGAYRCYKLLKGKQEEAP